GPAPLSSYFGFNFEYAGATTTLLPMEHVAVREIVESDPNLDYAIMRLDGAPGLTYGWALPSFTAPAVGDLLPIIQHPDGRPKEIGAGHAMSLVNGSIFSYAIDTDSGSSGAGILNLQGRLIGVHSDGGCTPRGGANTGLALAAAAGSPVLNGLARVAAPLRD